MIWKPVKNSLPNLNVLSNGGVEIGFVYKPNDTKTDKCAWLVHTGIGEKNKFVGFEWTEAKAKQRLEKQFN